MNFLAASRLDGKFLVSGVVLYLSSLLSIFIFQTDISYSYGLSTFVSPVFKKIPDEKRYFIFRLRDCETERLNVLFDEVAEHPVV